MKIKITKKMKIQMKRTTCTLHNQFADAWCALSKALNFTYTVRSTNEWGSFDNGTWNGMIRQLQDQEVDMW